MAETSPRPPPILFIHGYKGCSLVNTSSSSSSSSFLTLTQVLNLSSPDLSLPTTWTNNEQDRHQLPQILTPGPPLADPLGPCFSSILKARVYAPLLQTLSTEYGPPSLDPTIPSKFYIFSYDWRRSNNETVTQLKTFLEQLSSTPQVIAHSNGGLLVYSLLNDNPFLIHSVIYAAVPFKGNLAFLPDLITGKKIGLNKKILSAAVQRTFTLPFHLLPYRSEAAGLFLNEHNEEIRVDWHDIKTWNDNGLVEPGSAKSMHLIACLADAVKFKSTLAPTQPKDRYPKCICVQGNSIPTHDGAILVKRGVISTSKFKPKPGDGRFSTSCVQPPSGTVLETINSNKKHDSVLDGVDIISALKTLLESDSPTTSNSTSTSAADISIELN
ncbi:hypothetical protein TrLO_g1583 [Triparma laevis f. longispina]|uniref:Uncharacterized protein n=1 Tax=Triparma laevis f. longispina TaxID=1714387 RepID=A0A9W6ZYD8_9STRA|nr:hypothetical protein TrLO_g1583 [Triparma laevis f. longispina]